VIEFVQVSKQFGAQEIFRDVSLRVLPAERVGVVGPNGAGKSTLFALINGEISPDAGTVDVQRGLRIGTVRQQLRAHAFDGSLLAFTLRTRPELQVIGDRIGEIEHALPDLNAEARAPLLRELGNLQSEFEHLGGYTLKSRAEAALCGLGFAPEELERPFRLFSGGWQMRAELVRTLLAEPDMLLLDEPSNYLDLPAVEWLQKTLMAFPGCVMLISHDRFLLRTLARVIVEVADTIVTRYPCGYDRYLVEREERVRVQEAAVRNQEKRKEQIERFVERFRAKNTKASQVQSRLKMLDKMEEIRVPRLVSDAAYLRIATPPHCGSEVLRLEGVGHTYDGQRWVLRGVDLNIMRGDKIALVGFNGMGKTTLLRILAGVVTPTEGRRVLGHLVVPGYQSQDFAETMAPDETVYRVTKQANPEVAERPLRTLLGGFGFEGDAIEKRVDVLSGGEKIRLAFARLFMRPPNLLLLDEPTTHLDIQGRQTLEQTLRDYAGTVVLVSHDVTFVRNVATNIIALQPPGIQRYVGGYDYYRERVGAMPSEPAREAAAPAPADPRKERRRLRADQRREYQQKTRALKKEIEALEKSIHEAEAERAQVLADLESGKVTSYSVVNQHLTALQETIDEKTARWEEASTQLQQVEQELAGEQAEG
jgi:ATP-binding cassette subfamily F protein 3